MSEFSIDDFIEPIQRMSQGALLRVDAIESGEIDSMRDGDEYYSEITNITNTKGYKAVYSRTINRANLVDNIADSLLQSDHLATNLGGLLSGMVLSLADQHDMQQGRALTPLGLSRDRASQIVADSWLMRTGERQQRRDFSFYTVTMGEVAITAIKFSYSEAMNVWRLGYETEKSKVVVGSGYELGDIEIIEEAS